ncbi:TonB-dependent receptor [Erythrobacter sp. F6033]|uniref:TonB-dependent receptor n=1 Tax=Erythrobacter sp. F6033 TaxID=2926401 RepID=UPI001FF2DE83|nr:TonB-dependent receptor [Erythrobacter sp. F6033]MCK0127555.1 TonB-dependent receptor [Erythrobacter sp. F6033]
MIRTKLAIAALVTGCSLAAISTAATAQEAASSEARSYNIPAQSLQGALNSFAEASGSDLLYASDLVSGKQSSALVGNFTAAQALRQLLSGTGLTAAEVSANVYSLKAQGTATAGDASASPVSGVVTSAATGTALPSAQVEVVGTDLRTTTDQRGFFYFPEVAGTAFELRVTYLGQPAAVFPIPAGAFERARVSIAFGGEQTSDIVVVGYLSSIQKALNQQKNADNASTVVSSDLLGGFPAETVSEALRRVPGVAFGRDDDTGEGSRITVRGFGSEAINVQLNGLDLQGTGFERTIDLSGFLTDNISQITIHKSLLPSHESTGSGGLVEIETKSALDYGDFAFNFAIEGETNFDRKFGEEFQASGTFTKKITPNFAVSVTGQYRNTERLNYNASILDELPTVFPAGVTSDSRIPVDAVFPFDPEVQQQLVRSVNYVRRDREEESILGSINLAWDVASHTRLRLDFQRNVNNQTRVQSRASVNFFPTTVSMPIEELDGEVRSRRVLRSFAPTGGFETRDSEGQFDTISFRGDTDLDRWSFKYKLGYSRARTKGSGSSISLGTNQDLDFIGFVDPATIVINPDDDAAMTPRVVDGVFVEAANGLPIPSLSDAGITRIFDPSQYYILSAFTNEFDNPTEAYIAELKTRYSPKVDFLEYIEIGGKYDARTRRTSDDTTNPLNTRNTSYTGIFSNRIFLSDFGVDFFAEDLGLIGASGTEIPFLRGSDSDSIFAQLPGFTADDPSTPDFNELGFTFTDRTVLDPLADGASALAPTAVTEDELAAYLETKIVLGNFSLIAGGRYEREKRSGTNLTFPSILPGPGFAAEPAATFIAVGLYDFTDISGTVETFTPSFLASWRPSQNIVARLGYFRSTVHPDVRLLSRNTLFQANYRAGFEAVTIREANPDLQPTKTDNFDLDVAYYFTDSPGLIRGSLFYKKTTNNFTNVSFDSVPGDNVLERFLDYLAPLADTRPDLLAVPAGADLLINRPINGEGGTIWGAEFEVIRRLNFLPGFLSDFGVLANVTYTESDYPTLITVRNLEGSLEPQSFDRPLADQAQWSYNLSLDYAKDGFEGRVIYSGQSASAVTFDEFNRNVVSPAYSTLDLRLSYNLDIFGGLWTVFVEGDDLLRDAQSADIRSTVSSQFGDGDASFNFPQNYQFNGGRTITAGIRARF